MAAPAGNCVGHDYLFNYIRASDQLSYKTKRAIRKRCFLWSLEGHSVGELLLVGEGGDEYYTLMNSKPLEKGPLLSEVVTDYVRKRREITPPTMGRLVPVNEADRKVRMR